MTVRPLLSLLMVLGGLFLSSSSSQQTCEPPFDETAAVQALVDATPDGGTLDLTGQSFTVESIVRLDHPMTLTGGTFQAVTDGSCVPVPEGEKAANWPLTRRHVDITGSDVTISGTTVVGPNVDARYAASLELQHGVLVSGDAQRVALGGVTVRNVYGDCVSSGTRGIHGNVTVTASTLDGCGRQGVGISAGNDLTFDGVTIQRTGRSGFVIEPICVDGPEGPKTVCGEARRVTVTDSSFDQITNYPVAVVGYTVNVSDVTVTGNTFAGGLVPYVQARGGTSFCCEPGRSTNLTVTANSSPRLPTQPAITVENWDGVTIRGNSLPVRLPPKTAQVSWLRLTNSVGVLIGADNVPGDGDIEVR